MFQVKPNKKKNKIPYIHNGSLKGEPVGDLCC